MWAGFSFTTEHSFLSFFGMLSDESYRPCKERKKEVFRGRKQIKRWDLRLLFEEKRPPNVEERGDAIYLSAGFRKKVIWEGDAALFYAGKRRIDGLKVSITLKEK